MEKPSSNASGPVRILAVGFNTILLSRLAEFRAVSDELVSERFPVQQVLGVAPREATRIAPHLATSDSYQGA